MCRKGSFRTLLGQPMLIKLGDDMGRLLNLLTSLAHDTTGEIHFKSDMFPRSPLLQTLNQRGQWDGVCNVEETNVLRAHLSKMAGKVPVANSWLAERDD